MAWVRTAIAVMAFGFLIERFDLFIVIAERTIGSHTQHLSTQPVGHIAGMTLVVAGIAIIIISALRFVLVARLIDGEKEVAHIGSRVDIALAALLVLLGCALFLYLSHASML